MKRIGTELKPSMVSRLAKAAALAVLLMAAGPSQQASAEGPDSDAAWIVTEYENYIPGENVTIWGGGFIPGEAVDLVFYQDPEPDQAEVVVAEANGTGDIETSDYLVVENDVGTEIHVVATGETSGYVAETWFWDGGSLRVTGTPSTQTVAVGTTFSVTATVSNQGSGPSATRPNFSNILLQLNVPAPFSRITANPAAFSLATGNSTTYTWQVAAPASPTATTDLTMTVAGVPSVGLCGAANTCAGSDTVKVTVKDQTAPVITAPSAITAEATGPGGAVVTFTATATDNVDGSVPVACNPSSGSLFPLGTTHVQCTARDSSNNTSSKGFDVNVVDTTAPSLTVPSPIVAEATGPDGAVATFTASASDIVDGSITPSCSPASGSTFALGTTTVTCTATDAHGNSSSDSFDVTVQDTTAPTLTLPSDITAEATSAEGAAVSYSASATDIVDGSLSPSCSQASGSTFALGTTTVTCTATDAHGNSSHGSFSVTVQDTTPPTVTVPAPVVTEATGPSGATVSFSASASDLVDGSITPSCVPASGSTFAVGTTTVTCSATDAHGNTGSASFSVTVTDTTPPVLSLPSDITAEATSPDGAAVTYAASATDLVDGAVAVNCSPVSGSTFPLDATTTVNCSATDAHGNTASGTFSVSVVDTTAPDVLVPPDAVAEATGPDGAVVTYSPATAEDLVDGNLSASCEPASGSTFALGTTLVTCEATDAHGNTGSESFTVTVQDTTPPTLTLPASFTTTATSASGAVVAYTASASDLVDGSVTPVCSPASGSMFPLGSTTVSCTATDAHGNSSTGSFVVTVQFSWSGVLQPINADGSSLFKLGSTVPTKFKLTGGSAGVTNLVAKLYLTKFSSTTSGDELVATSTSGADSGNQFRYDTSGGQYIFNLATKGLSEGTWTLRIDLGDGSTNTVQISLKK